MNNDKQHGEFQNIDEVRAAIDAQIKPFFDDLLIAIKRMKGELPPEDLDKNEQW